MSQVPFKINPLPKIIKKVEGSTPWVSHLIVIPKKIVLVDSCVVMRIAKLFIVKDNCYITIFTNYEGL